MHGMIYINPPEVGVGELSKRFQIIVTEMKMCYRIQMSIMLES